MLEYERLPGSPERFPDDQRARLRLPLEPAAEPCPVVVYFHGGFWMDGYSKGNLDSGALLEAFGPGVATLDVEYARVDPLEPASSASGGGWPHTCLDALAALNLLAEAADAHSARLDLSRVYVCGHSAGGHIALWLGVLTCLAPAEVERLALAVGALAGESGAAAIRGGVRPPIRLAGVIGLAPVASLVAAAAAGLSDYHDATSNFLWRLGPSGAHAAATGALGAACPLSLLCTLNHEGGGAGEAEGEDSAEAKAGAGAEAKADAGAGGGSALRLLLVHGSADADVPASLSLALASACWALPQPARVRAQFLFLPGADHYLVAGLGTLDGSSRAEGAGTGAEPLAPPRSKWGRVALALRSFVATSAR